MRVLSYPWLTPRRALLIGILDMVFIISQCIPAKRNSHEVDLSTDDVEPDDSHMHYEPKDDSVDNYDTNVENSHDWSTENIDIGNEGVEPKKAIEEFISLSDNRSKKLSYLNSHDHPEESYENSLPTPESDVFHFDEDSVHEHGSQPSSENTVFHFEDDSVHEHDSVHSPESNVFHFDDDSVHEHFYHDNGENHLEDYILETHSSPVYPIMSWTESLLMNHKVGLPHRHNGKLHAMLEGMVERNQKMQDELEKLKHFMLEQ
ncbi:hypothetical protein NPIL_169141 [Nephila pilipes]|uniref:Uncharacterized protein n=1 Tax=Nephila pilipes TaxID=299642 RepID=A0A8X6Q2T2_NEPPI|nr:hypothetical protein NPIL_169141 [Nephila pilipes]